MIEYSIDKARGIIFTTVSGTVTSVDVMTHIDKILRDPDFSSDYHTVATVKDTVIFPPVEPETIEILQPVVQGYAQKRKGTKWAIVITKATTHAMVKEGLEFIKPLAVDIRLFRYEKDALNWIKE